MEKVWEEEQITQLLSSAFINECEKYAESKLDNKDFILLKDAYEKFPDTRKLITIYKNKKIYTIKRSSRSKYLKYLNEKLEFLINDIYHYENKKFTIKKFSKAFRAFFRFKR